MKLVIKHWIYHGITDNVILLRKVTWQIVAGSLLNIIIITVSECSFIRLEIQTSNKLVVWMFEFFRPWFSITQVRIRYIGNYIHVIRHNHTDPWPNHNCKSKVKMVKWQSQTSVNTRQGSEIVFSGRVINFCQLRYTNHV